jgi:hypothetical protein
MRSGRKTCRRFVTGLVLAASVLGTAAPGAAQTPPPSDGIVGAMAKSLTGDVYGDPTAWRELSLPLAR